MAENDSSELEALLASALSLHVNDGKAKCSLTGHEMPCRIEAIQTYLKGKKYQKASRKEQCDLMETHKGHLMPSNKRKHEHQLFCKLTCRHLNNEPHHIKRHVEGRRFRKALAKWEECQKTGATFKPLMLMNNRRRKDSVGSDSSIGNRMDALGLGESDEDGMSDDSMTDLYPPDDFKDFQNQMDDEEDNENEQATANVKSKTSQKKNAAQAKKRKPTQKVSKGSRPKSKRVKST